MWRLRRGLLQRPADAIYVPPSHPCLRCPGGHWQGDEVAGRQGWRAGMIMPVGRRQEPIAWPDRHLCSCYYTLVARPA